MAQLLTPPEYLIELKPQASAVVINAAISEQAALSLSAEDGANGQIVQGQIISGDDSMLVVETHPPEAAASPVFASALLQAAITIEEERHVFEARCVRPVPNTNPGIIYLVRPATVAILQRRRSRRYRLHCPQMVTLSAGTGEDALWWAGAMLNLSPEGLACRVREQDTGPIIVGSMLHLRFGVGETAEPFDLSGKVTNVTRGGSPGYIVLGVEFVFCGSPAEATKARLCQALSILDGSAMNL